MRKVLEIPDVLVTPAERGMRKLKPYEYQPPAWVWFYVLGVIYLMLGA